jgi:tetraacyldisaccharide 4'-kinase
VLVQHAGSGEQLRYGNRALDTGATPFSLSGDVLVNVKTGATKALADLSGHEVYAVAGIGNPERFFRYLERNNIRVKRFPKPDHAELSASDVTFGQDGMVLVTEKDAVKCIAFAHDNLWCLPVDVHFDATADMQWWSALRAKLKNRS